MASHDDHTHIDADDATRLAAATSSSGSGWLSSSGEIDHGRFPPGSMLGGRYRIVGRLGGGGMGEVYRADDLKLGQQVALKFLSPTVGQDPARLMQLHNEVRMARQVSHPNVCRVYDIDEVDGQTFLSMEFVDGEELGSLLRRFGRFSPDRAGEIARQICAGLAAAHERGVIHRDLKPANILLDGAGNARIADFGLAGVAGETVRAGTPAYMAPEQIAGGTVTAQSDIYALGLVLYELFTGQRAIDAKNVAELLLKREAGIVPPSQVVRDLDPAVDRAIMRCLERDPADRPASALGVSAALPGGDPLAAALAAGETPSPEMVAASGSTSALKPAHAVTALSLTLIVLVGLTALSDRILLTGIVPLSKPPAVLMDRAAEISRTLGYTEATADSAWGFSPAGDYLAFATDLGEGRATRERLRTGRPPGLVFWYRSSPDVMVPAGNEDRVTQTNPPLTTAGMRLVTIDTDGRLVEFHDVPPVVESPSGASEARAKWDTLLQLAGLNTTELTQVAPQRTPRVHSDERTAWEGAMPGWPQQRIRVEAAAYRGRPVYFQIVSPWTQDARTQEGRRSRAERWGRAVAGVAVIAVLAVAVLVARHNLRKGRGDRRGALRISTAVFAASLVQYLSGSSHFSDVNIELTRFFTAVGDALFRAGSLWLLYLALEPYVRKFWPNNLVSWSRLLAGNVTDAKVGRDVLLGALFGVGAALLFRASPGIRALFGYPESPPFATNISLLEGNWQVLAAIASMMVSAMFNALWIVFGLVAVKLIVRRGWVSGVIMTLFLVAIDAGEVAQTPPAWVALTLFLIVIAAMVFVAFRFGLLATVVMFFVQFGLSSAVLTWNSAAWFFSTSVTLLLIMAALSVYGFYASRGGEPLLGRRILD
jgi:serine/threonine-protein kinase